MNEHINDCPSFLQHRSPTALFHSTIKLSQISSPTISDRQPMVRERHKSVRPSRQSAPVPKAASTMGKIIASRLTPGGIIHGARIKKAGHIQRQSEAKFITHGAPEVNPPCSIAPPPSPFPWVRRGAAFSLPRPVAR